jgi:hypothetical protein
MRAVSRGLRLLIAGALAGVIVLALVATAGAGTPSPSVKIAKKAGGPYLEFAAVNVPDGETRTRYVRVRSKHNANQTATLTMGLASDGGPEYTFKWFRGKTNITPDIGDDGYDFTLKPDKDRIFKVRIKAPEGAEPICMTAAVEVPASSFGTATLIVNHALCAI